MVERYRRNRVLYGLRSDLPRTPRSALIRRTTYRDLRLYLIRWDASIYVEYRRLKNGRLRFVVVANRRTLLRGSAWEWGDAQRAAWQWIAANRAPDPERKELGVGLWRS